MKRKKTSRPKKKNYLENQIKRDKKIERMVYIILLVMALLFLIIGYIMFNDLSDWDDEDPIESPLLEN